MAGRLRGSGPEGWAVAPAPAVERFLAAIGKHVVYFAGYGELGYQDAGLVRRVVAEVLGRRSPADVIMHGSTLLREGGQDGIAEAYGVAQALGFTTTGIFPSVALAFGRTHRVSPHCDHVFFVEDHTWGGLLDGTDVPSPTLRLHLRVSHEIVVVGGGKHAADEMRAFAAHGRSVTYVPARMNSLAAQRWCREEGRALPDPHGAARDAWYEMAGLCAP